MWRIFVFYAVYHLYDRSSGRLVVYGHVGELVGQQTCRQVGRDRELGELGAACRWWVGADEWTSQPTRGRVSWCQQITHLPILPAVAFVIISLYHRVSLWYNTVYHKHWTDISPILSIRQRNTANVTSLHIFFNLYILVKYFKICITRQVLVSTYFIAIFYIAHWPVSIEDYIGIVRFYRNTLWCQN